MRAYLKILFFPILTGLLICGCSTNKKAGSNVPFAKRTFHNVTARYNGYYHAKLKLNNCYKNLLESYEDDYDKILPLYPYSAVTDASIIAPEADGVIAKTSFVIELHKPSKWTDDSYYLLGQARYLQQDYEEALNVFQYITTEYRNGYSKTIEKSMKKKGSKKKKKTSAKKKVQQKKKAAAKKSSAKKKPAVKKNSKKKKKTSVKKKKRKKKPLSKKKRKKKKRKASSSKKQKVKKAKKPEPKAKVKETVIPFTRQTPSGLKKSEDVQKEEVKVKKKKKVRVKDRKRDRDKEEEEEKEDDEEINDKKGLLHFIQHKPVNNDAVLWIIKSFIELGDYVAADATITVIESEELDLNKKQIAELEVLKAHLYISKEDYNEALFPLIMAIDLTKKKKKKTRLQFIVAQLYQKTGDNQSAMDNYQMVLEGRPDYVMEFYSKLNIARSYVESGSMSGREVMKMLEKLLQDVKNEEYYDQIYYTMALIALNESYVIPNNKKDMTHKELAIYYLNGSIETSLKNTKQKALSYLELADIYFRDDMYPQAKVYYDSSLSIISKANERYSYVENQSTILEPVVTSLMEIKLQDSLLSLAALPEAQRIKIIKNAVAKVESKLERSSEESSESSESPGGEGSIRVTSQVTSKSSWYFYNSGAKSKGHKEFRNRWGELILERDWRRNAKKTGGFEVAVFDLDDTPTLTVGGDLGESMLKEIPVSEAAKSESIDKIVEAYYTLGTAYREKLANYPKAISTFEELVDRFPGNKYEEEAYYTLYLLYSKKSDYANAQKYKDLLLSEHANSPVTQYLLDPSFENDEMKLYKKIQKFYTGTYDLYLQNEFEEVIKRKTEALSQWKNNDLMAKFDFLAALSIGKTKDKNEFKRALYGIIRKYPDDDVRERAQEILTYMNQKNVDKTKVKKPRKLLSYSYKPSEKHLVALVISNPKVSIKDLNNKISDYNTKYHSLKKLKSSKIIYNQTSTIILIKKFKNKNKAFGYETQLKNKKEIFDGISKSDYKILLFSEKNYNTFFKEKDMEGYESFYSDKYGK